MPIAYLRLIRNRNFSAYPRPDDGKTLDLAVLVRIDTAEELDYDKHGGVLEYAVRQLAAA